MVLVFLGYVWLNMGYLRLYLNQKKKPDFLWWVTPFSTRTRFVNGETLMLFVEPLNDLLRSVRPTYPNTYCGRGLANCHNVDYSIPSALRDTRSLGT